jgi:hypothetical protein
MDISGLVQQYDARASSSTAITREIMAPQYVPVNAYSGAPSGGLIAMHHQQQAHPPQQLPFNLSTCTPGASNGFIPAFATNYIQQQSYLPIVELENNGDRVSYHHNQHRGFIEQHIQRPIIKEEQQQWRNSPPYTPTPVKTTSPIPATSGAEAVFGTEVDTLMKAIQAKSTTTQPHPKSIPFQQTRPVVCAPYPACMNTTCIYP